MLQALIGLNVINYNIPQKLKAEINWVLKHATNLEDSRNDLLHSPVFKNGPTDIFAWHHLGNKRAKKLEGKDILKEAIWFYDSVIVLRDYTEILIGALSQIRSPPGATLPKRPSLPNRGATNGK